MKLKISQTSLLEARNPELTFLAALKASFDRHNMQRHFFSCTESSKLHMSHARLLERAFGIEAHKNLFV